MTWGEIAGLVAAAAAVVFVALSAIPLWKLGGVMDELRLAVRKLGDGTTPILDELKGTVSTTTEEIARLSLVTEELAKMSHNATTMTEQVASVSTVVSTPLVKTAEVMGRTATAARDVGRRVQQRRPRRDPQDPRALAAQGASDAPDSLGRTSEHDLDHEQGQL
ncbi:DUF948 domain-containing protein [Luteococcus sp. Sow4_B9]|uniref:DUF948 domain-containing protein n=1 Tax=Luteococcus sp. Sow4_B9 TaxID=3438792 RepID=UPI003F97BAE5